MISSEAIERLRQEHKKKQAEATERVKEACVEFLVGKSKIGKLKQVVDTEARVLG